MLREDAALQCVALLARHRRDVQRVRGLFVLRLLQLPAVDEVHVGDGRPSRLSGVLVLEAAAQRGQNLRPVVSSARAAVPRLQHYQDLVPVMLG